MEEVGSSPNIKTQNNETSHQKTLNENDPVENVQMEKNDSIESNELVQKVISAENIDKKSETVHKIKSETVVNEKPEIIDNAKSEIIDNTKSETIDNNTISEIAENAPPVKVEKENLEVINRKDENKMKNKIADILAPIKNPTKQMDKRRIGTASSGFAIEKINRNQSDIFSLKDENSITSSIFSVNGSPSRKVYRRVQKVPSSNVFPFGQMAEPLSGSVTPRDKMRDKESYHDIKRPSSSLRNPLTGTGLNSNDEYKFRGNKKIDGNPLLGVGYSPEATPSTHRIPPGGYSHKLW